MLHIRNEYIRKHILEGNFGLEKEGLRVLPNGKISHTVHPFPGDKNIVRDFCENQTEINTSVHSEIEDMVRELEYHHQRICEGLQQLPQKEYLWLFSNPPYIENEKDIPVAVFSGSSASKTAYREYLSDKYGRYKMIFSGIHVNFSFAENVLQADFALHGGESFSAYKDSVYLDLAKKMIAYGWILVAVTAASPLLDSSFVEKGVYDRDVFTGMASVRCSEMGYWNHFTPILRYESAAAYADSIRKYVEEGFLTSPSELYYPVRLKPRGKNRLDTLRKNGVDHIELRMFDLNPLTESGVEKKDIAFAHLLMIWLAAMDELPFPEKDQVQAVQNFKNAARYDLKTVKIQSSEGKIESVADAAMTVIDKMKAFYRELDLPVQEILEFEYEKFTDAGNRYAWKIREQFGQGYVKKALDLAKERQDRKYV